MSSNKTFNYSREDIILGVPHKDTINNIDINIDDLISWIDFNNNLIEYYSFILHDKDNVYAHYHLLLHFNKKIEPTSLINNVARFFKININNVECKPCSNFRSYSRYLIHLDNPEKFQYSIDEVKTSDFEMYCQIINSSIDCFVKFDDFDINKLIQICLMAKSLIEVYSIVGIEKSQKYRFIIQDIFKGKSALKNKYKGGEKT